MKVTSLLFAALAPCLSLFSDEMKTVAGITVDPKGNPVPYVDIAPKWNGSLYQGKSRLVIQSPERNGSGKSDHSGAFFFSMMENWWEGILAYDEQRTTAGVAIVPRKEAPRDLKIVMAPATEVTFALASSSSRYPLRTGTTSVFYRPEGSRHYSMILSQSSVTPRLFLPPGNYEAKISAGTMYGKNNIKWKVLPGQKLLNLGEVQVPLVKWADQPEGKAPPLRFSHIRGLPETTSWDSLRGKWVYINFWAHWCGPCQRKMKDLVPWYHDNQHQRDHFEVIFVHASDARDFAIVDEKMPGLAARHWGIGKPFPFPMMLDADRDIASSYGVRLFPTEILVDPSGVVVTRPGGPGAFDELKAKLGR